MIAAHVLGLAALASAVPAPVARNAEESVASCTFSRNEQLNLWHQHDVNTGKIKLNGAINGNAPQVGGSGCSPAWANGGALDDETPQKTRVECKRGATCGPPASV